MESPRRRRVRRHAAGVRSRPARSVFETHGAVISSRLIAGIWPLTSFRNAEFMVNELRVPVPEEYMERMRRAESAEAARAEGIAIARQMVERVRPMVAGRAIERSVRTLSNGHRSRGSHRLARIDRTIVA